MFLSEHSIATIFRLINFTGLIALFIYLFKKYLRPIIVISVGQKEAVVRNLFNQQQMLEQEQYALDERAAKEVKQCVDLKEKVIQWKNVVDQEIAKRDKERGDRIKILRERAHQRVKRCAIDQVKRQVLAHATTQTALALGKRFADVQKGHSFIKPIINFMRERTS